MAQEGLSSPVVLKLSRMAKVDQEYLSDPLGTMGPRRALVSLEGLFGRGRPKWAKRAYGAKVGLSFPGGPK